MNFAVELPEDMPVDWVRAWARYSPTALAFKDAESGRNWTYAQLNSITDFLAETLTQKYGVRLGDRVAVLANNELEYPAILFALQRLGAILVPINFRLTAPEVAHILADAECKLLIHQQEFLPLLEKIVTSQNLPTCWLFEDMAQKIASLPEQDKRTTSKTLPWKPEDPCMILYTSGTTGTPKGALITHRMIFWNAVNTSLRLNLNQNDIALGFLPFFHTSGWNVLLTPFLHRGATTVLLKKFSPQRVLELTAKEGVTVLFGVPTTMEMMAREQCFVDVDLKSVRYAIVGGEPMPIELIRIWQKKGVPIRQGYGLTEFGPNVFSLNEEDSLRKIGSIGFPNFYVEAKILADDRSEIVDGSVGELALRGPVCTPGYWRNKKASLESFHEDWFLTGDLVRRDEDGYFYVAGRKKEMFISGGENVYPVEVERVLSSHPAIREVAVIGIADARWGEVGLACVALHSGCEFNMEMLTDFCIPRLAKFKIPKALKIHAELPKGDSGKILKRRLVL